MRQSVSPPPPAANGKIILVSGPESANASFASVDNESPAHPAIKLRRSICFSRSDYLAQYIRLPGVMEWPVDFRHRPETRKSPVAVRPPGGFCNLLDIYTPMHVKDGVEIFKLCRPGSAHLSHCNPSKCPRLQKRGNARIVIAERLA